MRPWKIIRVMALLASFGAAPALTACNTIEGIGEDISALGRGVSRGAESTKQKM
jgi:predicted small secreted protein